jgi:hypothetical protein
MQQKLAASRRHRAALDLIHHIDTMRVLALVGRLTPHDGLAMSEAVDNYTQTTKACRELNSL